MLKKLKIDDIDYIMKLWKNEFDKNNKFLKNEVLVNIYTKARNNFINNLNTTTIYTEDGKIEGFISINKKNEITDILIIENIRREGIGTILIENAKKKYKNLKVNIDSKNEIALKFFYKNGFKKTDEINEPEVNKAKGNATEENETKKNVAEKDKINNLKQIKYVLEWKEEINKKIDLIYFDEDIDKKTIKKESKLNLKCLNIKEFLKEENIQETEINNIKTYIKLRKKIEDIIEGKKVYIYINYDNYYKFLDEIIKEVVKIKKIDLQIIICEPFTIEGTKKNKIIKQIESEYKNYSIHKIDCSLNIKEDINLNQIFEKRNQIIIQEIEKIIEKA